MAINQLKINWINFQYNEKIMFNLIRDINKWINFTCFLFKSCNLEWFFFFDFSFSIFKKKYIIGLSLTKYQLMLIPRVARNLNNLWLLHNAVLMRLHWAFQLMKYCPSALNRNKYPIDGNAFYYHCFYYKY